jgi:hypothetical protein
MAAAAEDVEDGEEITFQATAPVAGGVVLEDFPESIQGGVENEFAPEAEEGERRGEVDGALFEEIPVVGDLRVAALDLADAAAGGLEMDADRAAEETDPTEAAEAHGEIVILAVGVERESFVEAFLLEDGAADDHVAAVKNPIRSLGREEVGAAGIGARGPEHTEGVRAGDGGSNGQFLAGAGDDGGVCVEEGDDPGQVVGVEFEIVIEEGDIADGQGDGLNGGIALHAAAERTDDAADQSVVFQVRGQILRRRDDDHNLPGRQGLTTKAGERVGKNEGAAFGGDRHADRGSFHETATFSSLRQPGAGSQAGNGENRDISFPISGWKGECNLGVEQAMERKSDGGAVTE